MSAPRSGRRMTLRELLIHSEKNTRDLLERLQVTLVPSLIDLRKLSRPVRQNSHYPTFVTMKNAMKKVEDIGAELKTMTAALQERLNDIRAEARRERAKRI